jgi:DNA-binding beta-propeller fold protein YncE
VDDAPRTFGAVTFGGPGLGKVTFSAAELGKPVAIIRSANAAGVARGHANVAMHKGYLFVPYSTDSGQPGGGISFYDVSNPRLPALVYKQDVNELREAHGFGFSSSYPGDYAVMQTIDGIEFWDFTNVRAPVLLKHLVLPGVEASDYAAGAWWTFWQAPWVYVGGSGNGIYVVDATDPRKPVLVKQVPTSQTGGFRLGSTFAIGNLLVSSSMDQSGYATFDISDPKNPVLLTSINNNPAIYSMVPNADRIYGAGKDGRLYVHDISNPRVIRPIGSSPVPGSKGGYVAVQDNFVLGGFSTLGAKIDVSNPAAPTISRTFTSNVAGRDEDFAFPLGNMVFVGSDHPVGSGLLAHQSAPDSTPPTVTMSNPRRDAVNQALSSRVGLTFSEAVDLQTIDGTTFMVRPPGGAALSGKYSLQGAIVNFAPSAPLLANTTYEVVVPAAGLRDLSGNATATELRFQFSTGASVSNPLGCAINATTPTSAGASATLAVTARGNGPIQYSYDFGDGSAPLAGGVSASHTFSRAGHYPVVVTVNNAAERTTCSRLQTVFNPLPAARPTASSSIAYDAATNLVWVVNPDSDSVTAIDGPRNVKKLEAPVGKSPRTLGRAPDGTIWVVNQEDASISVLDATSGAPLASIELPYASRPYGLAFDPAGQNAYLTLEATGKLLRLSPAARTVVGSLTLGDRLRGVAVSADGTRVLVTRFISPVDHGEVLEVSASSLGLVRAFTLATDTGPDTESSGRGVPNYLSQVVISPDGLTAWIPSKKDNTLRGLFRDGQPLTFENTVRTITSQIDLGKNVELVSDRIDHDNRDLAQAVAFGKFGDYAFIVTQGTNTIEIHDAYNHQLVSGIGKVGLAPQGLVFSPDFKKLFVNDFTSRDVSVFDVSGFLDGSNTTISRLGAVATVASERLPAEVLRGEQIFYNADDRRMNRDGYISCASCHLDGDSDGRVWDFTQRGEGLRNTIELLGRRGTGMGRLHWTGNFDEVQDFENDIRNSFAGTGFLSDADFAARQDPLGSSKAGKSPDLDALAAFVSSLSRVRPSPFRNPDGSFTADALAGKELFDRLQCGSCHSGVDFTDSAQGALHNVGTIKASSGQRLGGLLTGLDTPTLKGLWGSAPYLHDGSAATLVDVLVTANLEGQHGITAALSGAELGQLVAYLNQLDDSDGQPVQLPLPFAVTVDFVSTGKTYTTVPVATGVTYYIDRTYVVSSVSPGLVGGTLVRTANDDKFAVAPAHLELTISRPATVFVAVDRRAATLPAWLDGSWKAGSESFVGSDRSASPMRVYAKAFPAGQVTLGANGQPPSTNLLSQYVIIVHQ